MTNLQNITTKENRKVTWKQIEIINRTNSDKDKIFNSYKKK